MIVLPLTELFPEKFLKKLIGMTDIEDALYRLEKLIQEETRMATAQVLMVTTTVDDKVQGIANDLVSVDSKVASVDDRVASIDDRMKDVHDDVDQMKRS